MNLTYAETLADVQRVLDPRPLRLADMAFFVETEAARDPFVNRRDLICDLLQSAGNTKVLVFGHAGCGKSTELAKLQEEHGGEFQFVSFSVRDDAALTQASVEALLVLIVDTVARVVGRELQCPINEQTLEEVHNWFSDVVSTHESTVDFTGEGGVGADLSQSFLAKLLGLSAHLKSDIKAGSRTLNQVITRENRRLSELAYHCDLLVKDAKLAVREKLGRDLVLVIEDLDKLSLEAADALLLQNPAPLADLGVKAILTAPIWLLCNPRSASLEALFERVTIPMVKVSDEDGHRVEEGRECVARILAKRLDTASLIVPEALDLAVAKTGGVLRHLFEVLAKAAFVARQAVKRQARPVERIDVNDVRYGLDQMKSELVRRLGVFGLPAEYQQSGITYEAMAERLADIAAHPRRLASDPMNLLLLQAHAVIEYNGKGWHAVHPLIAEHISENP